VSPRGEKALLVTFRKCPGLKEYKVEFSREALEHHEKYYIQTSVHVPYWGIGSVKIYHPKIQELRTASSIHF
jgi:hypothetical protein